MVLLSVLIASMVAVTSADAAGIVYSPLHKKDIRYTVSARHGAVPATWYGPGFWGNRTGCGSTLRTSTWGVAHRTLPCGQLVMLKFGRRRVAVPVVDRGPFSGATLDLTLRTSDRLGFTRHGTSSVRMTVLRQRVPVRRL